MKWSGLVEAGSDGPETVSLYDDLLESVPFANRYPFCSQHTATCMIIRTMIYTVAPSQTATVNLYKNGTILVGSITVPPVPGGTTSAPLMLVGPNAVFAPLDDIQVQLVVDGGTGNVAVEVVVEFLGPAGATGPTGPSGGPVGATGPTGPATGLLETQHADVVADVSSAPGTTPLVFTPLLTVPITTALGSTLLVNFSASADNATGGSQTYFALYVDGNLVKGATMTHPGGGVGPARAESTAIVARITGLLPGPHNVEIRWATNIGTSKVNAILLKNQQHGTLLVEEVNV